LEYLSEPFDINGRRYWNRTNDRLHVKRALPHFLRFRNSLKTIQMLMADAFTQITTQSPECHESHKFRSKLARIGKVPDSSLNPNLNPKISFFLTRTYLDGKQIQQIKNGDLRLDRPLI